MKQTTRIPNFLLKEGVLYSKCNPSQICAGTEMLGAVKTRRIVDLVIQRSPEGMPIRANAYIPNEVACSRKIFECQLDLVFEGEQLARLISGSSQILNYSRDDSISKVENPFLAEENISYSQSHELLPFSINPYYALGVIVICIPIAIAIMVRQLRKRNLLLRSMVKNESHNRNTNAAMRASPSTHQVQTPRSAAKSLGATNKMARREYQSNTDQKIEEILLRLDSLEQQMTSVLVRTSFRADKIDEAV